MKQSRFTEQQMVVAARGVQMAIPRGAGYRGILVDEQTSSSPADEQT